MKKLSSNIIYYILFIFLSTSIACGGGTGNHKITTEETILSGKLITGSFTDANDKAGRVYILELPNPIDINEDEFGGPEKNVSQVQLAIPSTLEEGKYLNKNIEVEGKLFFPISAHHHTKVLFEVKKMRPLME